MPRQLTDKIHNLPEKEEFRRKLRKRLTPAEAELWSMLKNSKIDGRKFRRQHSVGPYILDFYCPAEHLAIEMDGEGHFGALAQLHDRKRRLYLNQQGIKVLRFENEFVFQDPVRLLEVIRGAFGWEKRGEPSFVK